MQLSKKFKKQKIYKTPNNGPEVKRLDKLIDGTTADISSNWGFLSGGGVSCNTIVAMTRGTTDVTRVGDQIRIIGLEIRLNLQLPAISVDNRLGYMSNAPRIVVFKDKQPNGASIAMSDLFTIATLPCLSFYNLANDNRFQILWDKTYEISQYPVARSSTATGSAETWAYHEICIPMDTIVRYNTNFGTVADITKNNIGIVVVGSTSNTNIVIDANIRITYLDL